MGSNQVRVDKRTKTLQYEKTTSDQEVVAGRFGSYGTAVTQAKLQTANPDFVFTEQKSNYNLISGKTNSTYAQNGEPADIDDEIGAIHNMTLDDGETLVKGDPIQGELTTGKVQKLTKEGIQAGRAYESKSASGADGKILVEFDPNTRKIVETLTPSTHVSTPTKTPIRVEHIEALAGDGTLGELLKDYENATPAAGHAYVNLSAGTITTNATDNWSSIKVEYDY